MSVYLDSVTSGVTMKPIRAVIVGHPGVGKTTLAAGSASPIFQTVEDGLGLIDAACLPMPQTFSEVIGQYKELEFESHPYKSLVVDAVDGIEPMIYKEICDEDGKDAIADIAWNKGYVRADVRWVTYFQSLDRLRRKGMNIILISHAKSEYYDDPTVGSYVRYEPNLHKRTVPLLTKWSDVIGFLDMERSVVDRGDADKRHSVRTSMASGSRFLHLCDTGSFIAKNRFNLPESLEIPLNGWPVLRDALAVAFKENGKPKKKKKTKQEAA